MCDRPVLWISTRQALEALPPRLVEKEGAVGVINDEERQFPPNISRRHG